MKNIEKVLLLGCGYTVLILAGFYLFALFAELASLSIAIDKFFLILLFGMVISVTEAVTAGIRLNKILRHIIRYAVLLSAFSVIILPSATLNVVDATFVFVAVIIFTVLYAFGSLVVFAVRTGLNRIARTAKSATDKGQKKSAKTSEYTPLYKD